jgi:hypothetical protein
MQVHDHKRPAQGHQSQLAQTVHQSQHVVGAYFSSLYIIFCDILAAKSLGNLTLKL